MQNSLVPSFVVERYATLNCFFFNTFLQFFPLNTQLWLLPSVNATLWRYLFRILFNTIWNSHCHVFDKLVKPVLSTLTSDKYHVPSTVMSYPKHSALCCSIHTCNVMLGGSREQSFMLMDVVCFTVHDAVNWANSVCICIHDLAL